MVSSLSTQEPHNPRLPSQKPLPEKYTLKLFPGDSTIDSLLIDKGLRPHLAYVGINIIPFQIIIFFGPFQI